ncbi:hypothetical protein T11_2031 [Trichinella zimbabwensis]|uniref:Uncharacterized protein n=1 Tax=Trichinella zimbabwensis TaxID=268475 RepID=A0A0V1HS02_9BILA|nr:hypothetical protein T11_2031 [Trichinella zimbabwensis]
MSHIFLSGDDKNKHESIFEDIFHISKLPLTLYCMKHQFCIDFYNNFQDTETNKTPSLIKKRWQNLSHKELLFHCCCLSVDRYDENLFMNKCRENEKGQRDMTKVNAKANGSIGGIGKLRAACVTLSIENYAHNRNFDIIQRMLNFLTDLRQAAAPVA